MTALDTLDALDGRFRDFVLALPHVGNLWNTCPIRPMRPPLCVQRRATVKRKPTATLRLDCDWTGAWAPRPVVVRWLLKRPPRVFGVRCERRAVALPGAPGHEAPGRPTGAEAVT